LGRNSILGAGLFLEKYLFWEQAHFWREKIIFGSRATRGRKETCRKRRKTNMQEEKKRGTHADRINRDRVRVFDKHCNDYKPIK
jgi:hypothetical protein